MSAKRSKPTKRTQSRNSVQKNGNFAPGGAASSVSGGAACCRALILVDDVPLRSSASLEIKKLYTTYSRHRSELTHHDEKVRPAYYRWFFGLFSERLKKVEHLHAAYLEKSALLQRIRDLCIFEGFTPSSAFEQANEERREERQAEEEARAREEEEFGTFHGDGGKTYGAGGDDDRDRDETDEDFDGRTFEDLMDDLTGARGNERARASEEAQSRESKIKYFYRKLVQALHPDLAGGQSDLSREFWQETQDAHKARDLDRLKLLWTLIMLQTDKLSREIRLFDLRAAATHLKDKIRSIKQEKRRISNDDPSWGFDKKDKSRFATKIRSELEREESNLQNALEELEEDLQFFAKFSRQGRRKKAPQGQMSFEF